MLTASSREVLRYLDQVVDVYDPSFGLTLPEAIAWVVSVAPLADAGGLDEPGATWLARLTELLRDPAAPRVRTLILHDWSEHAPDPWDIPFEEGDATPLLRKYAGRLARLERLYVGAFPGWLPPTRGFCQGVGPALAELPSLEYLQLVGARGWDLLPPAGHPRLRALLLHVAEPDDEPLALLEQASFPALERFDLWAGAAVTDGLDLAMLAAALASPGLAALRELALRGVEAPELLVELAAHEDLGARLHSLAVTHAPELDDDALAELLAAPWLSRLRRLDLRGTGASPALTAELGARGLEVVV